MLKKIKGHSGAGIKVSHDPATGVKGVDVIYTDVWVSAGMEEEKKRRMEVFPPYQVGMDLVRRAKPDCIVINSIKKVDLAIHPIVMHCLPAHRGYEITDEVMDSPYSVVFEQAGNRMWAQMGLLIWLLNNQ
jgi:ornithine carbamoyltransferase